MNWLLVGGLAVGVLVGIFSGLVGVGGGIILIPILVYLFKMDMHTAQGTSLAMLLPPTGLLAFIGYYNAGHVNWKLGLIIAAGVFVGGYFGGVWAQQISASALKKIFAAVLLVTAVKLYFE
jgi:uncharacterized membrane protein YfcA